MGPKIKAAIDYIQRGGERSADHIGRKIAGGLDRSLRYSNHRKENQMTIRIPFHPSIRHEWKPRKKKKANLRGI